MMTKLKIISCNDSQKWYAKLIGQEVPLLAVEETEYKTLQPDGFCEGHRFINYISKKDAEIVYDNELRKT